MSIKNVGKIAIIVLSLGLVVVLMGLAESERKQVKFSDLKIRVEVTEGNTFVSNLDVESAVFAHGYQKGRDPIVNVDLRQLENQFDNMPSVKKSEVYYTLNGKLCVEIEQRIPIARVFTPTGGYYIDEEGYIMPLSDKYTARVPVVNGNIFLDYTSVKGLNVAKKTNLQKGNKQQEKLHEAFVLAKKFRDVPLWNAQFKQVYFNKSGDIELIPAVGNHIIVIDGAEGMDESLTKLLILYKEGLSKTGWNNYSIINLKYKDQIVCIKR